MHYEPALNNHGLPHRPFNALVVPRPIGWISTISKAGVVNLAPFSFYNAIASAPPMVMFSSGIGNDSLANAEESGEFTVSLATFELRTQMNASSTRLPPDESEFLYTKLEMAPSKTVKPPRVKLSPAALECRYVQSVPLATADGAAIPYRMVIGEVTGIYIDDSLIVDGMVDIRRARPIARLGYHEYEVLGQVFQMQKPF